ncbi:MAG: hypothetical protein ACTSR0_07555 [Candidatus Asgardarchaeia archaeon]
MVFRSYLKFSPSNVTRIYDITELKVKIVNLSEDNITLEKIVNLVPNGFKLISITPLPFTKKFDERTNTLELNEVIYEFGRFNFSMKLFPYKEVEGNYSPSVFVKGSGKVSLGGLEYSIKGRVIKECERPILYCELKAPSNMNLGEKYEIIARMKNVSDSKIDWVMLEEVIPQDFLKSLNFPILPYKVVKISNSLLILREIGVGEDLSLSFEVGLKSIEEIDFPLKEKYELNPRLLLKVGEVVLLQSLPSEVSMELKGEAT